jgi:diguanylate cyclase (GGDEF)-like protein/PAS domain S-box-containing protein
MNAASFRTVFEDVAHPMAMATPSGRFIEVNKAYCRFLGYARPELLEKSVFEITHPADLDCARTLFKEVADGLRDQFHYQKRYLRKDGREVHARITTVWMKGRESNHPVCIATIEDITPEPTHVSTFEETQISQSLLENIDLGVNLVDEEHQVLYANRGTSRMLRKDLQEIIGQKCFRTFAKTETVCRYCPGVRAMKDGMPHSIEKEGRREDGSSFIVNVQAIPVFDKDGKSRKFIEVAEDITQRRAIEKELKLNQDRIDYLAHHDSLTGLPNRTLLYDRLKLAIDRAQRYKEQLSVIIFELDGIKKINDALGFDARNQLIKDVSTRFKVNIRKTDSLCFLGRDLFGMVLDKADSLQRSAFVARKILSLLKFRPFFIFGHELHLTASIGISHYPEDGQDVEALLRAAESARGQARENGGDGYQYYQAEMEKRSRYYLRLQGELHRALEKDQLAVFYQAQVDPTEEKLSGIEALARWRHPERGLVSPAEFIPLAEDIGLIVPLGRRVMEITCKQAKQWKDAGLLPFRVAVNVSPVQVARGNLEQMVKEVLNETGLPPEHLEIEITETALANNPEKTLQVLTNLKNMGVALALDDFGTGYSSLGFLQKYPIDRIKIAREFIRSMLHNDRDAAIVESIIALGKKLGMGVVAEGVETKDTLGFLLAFGCTNIQGFYYAKPMDGKTFSSYLKDWCGARSAYPLKV